MVRRSPAVGLSDLASTGIVEVTNEAPSTDAYGLVVRTIGGGGAGGGSTAVRVTNTTAQRLPVILPSSFIPGEGGGGGGGSTAVRVTNTSTQPLPISGVVSLSTGSLLSLENISVDITDTFIEIANDAGNPVPVSGTVTLSNPTTGVSIENPTTAVRVTNTTGQRVPVALPANFAPPSTVFLAAASLAALETINAVQSGTWTFSLSTGSLAALETIQAVQSGTWSVGITNPTTAVRVTNPSTAVRVTNTTGQRVPGRVTQDGAWTVGLSTASLAALETITVANPTTGVSIENPTTAVRVTNSTGQRVPGRVTQDGSWTVALSTGSLAALETITVANPTTGVSIENPTTAVRVTNSTSQRIPVTVAGTVTANLGSIDGAATEATLASILTELGQKYEGGPVSLSTGTLAALETISVSGTVNTASAPSHVQLDYVSRGDTQPVYMGKAAEGVGSTAAAWTVTKFRYESSTDDARTLEFDVRTGIGWDNRADPTADGKTAWTF